MARSIRDMKKDAGRNAVRDTPEVTPELERSVNGLISRYSGKSDDELMSELKRVTAEQKRNGTLDAAQIDAAASSILPMLNAEQARKLQSILSQIK